MKITKKIWCSVAAVISLITGGAIVGQEYVQPVGQVVIEGQALGELRISQKGLEIIGNAEGCRQDPYKCPAGLRTNGIGNTHGVPNHVVTLEQIAKDWVKNIKEAEQCVTDAERLSGRRLNQGQFDGFTSFVFNFGCTKFRKNEDGTDTRIYRAIKQGRFIQGCGHIQEWVKSDGIVLPGLVTRRGLEYARCMEVD
ncbi:lysozyme [Vibrio cholerae]|uniref:lysozyme n=1 Tax=Vibrio cholerae TaxID=666 RepID=UPI0011D4AE27|nr:lysozyme [Vibrio cholerae]TXX57042.1 lysozyme [Vibrio cholerae]GIB54290.1 lysozyme [Vibrio cholerae]